MELMNGMCLASHALGFIACNVATAVAAYQGEWKLAGILLFFVLVNAAGVYANYRSLKASGQETATKEEER